MEDKTRVATKCILEIYKLFNKGEITKLEDFKNVNWKQFCEINKKGLVVLENMQNELFPLFEKKKCRYYDRAIAKNYILIFVKFLCKEINKKIATKEGSRIIVDDKVKANRTYYIKNPTE